MIKINKILLVLIILILCGCNQQLKEVDTHTYSYDNAFDIKNDIGSNNIETDDFYLESSLVLGRINAEGSDEFDTDHYTSLEINLRLSQKDRSKAYENVLIVCILDDSLNEYLMIPRVTFTGSPISIGPKYELYGIEFSHLTWLEKSSIDGINVMEILYNDILVDIEWDDGGFLLETISKEKVSIIDY